MCFPAYDTGIQHFLVLVRRGLRFVAVNMHYVNMHPSYRSWLKDPIVLDISYYMFNFPLNLVQISSGTMLNTEALIALEQWQIFRFWNFSFITCFCYHV